MPDYIQITRLLSLYLIHPMIGRLISLHTARSVTPRWARPLHTAWWAWGVLEQLGYMEGPAGDALRRSVTAWAAGVILYLLWDRFWQQRGREQPSQNPIFDPGFNLAIEWFLELVVFLNCMLPTVLTALVPNGGLLEWLAVLAKQRGIIAAPVVLWKGPQLLDFFSEQTRVGSVIDMFLLIIISKLYGLNFAPTDQQLQAVLGVPLDETWLRYMLLRAPASIQNEAGESLIHEAIKVARGDAQIVNPVSMSVSSSSSTAVPLSVAEFGGLEAILA